MKRILITGANSYIGMAFEKYIKDCHSNEYSVDTLDMIDGSWREVSFSEYDSVFHVAGIAHQKETKKNAHLYYEINRDLAFEVAKKAKTDGASQFIFLSSMSVYGVVSGEISLKNDVAPNTNYGKSKLEAERLLDTLRDKSFKVAVLRPPMVYGKGCKGNCNFLRKWIKTIHVFPNYNNKRSMISIENLREFVYSAVDGSFDGLYFPRDPEYMSATDLVKRIAEDYQIKVAYTRLFNPIIRCLRIGLVKKVFGNYVYEDDQQ